MITKRIFGSPIPTSVQKKLEARQLVAEGGKNPNDVITSQYDVGSTDTFKDLISSNFDMQADLSSRTPFARMWTSVQLFEESQFIFKEGEDVSTNDGSNSTDSVEKTKNKDSSLTSDEELINKIAYQPLDGTQQIYVVGTNNLHTLFPQNETDTVTGQNAIARNLVPSEHLVTTPILETELVEDEATQTSSDETVVRQIDDNNKFMKPQAGIVSINSSTEGTLGSIKKTTVNFVVHNFADYDAIYNRYFLRPGAQVFVDFGWDALVDTDGVTMNLYDPSVIIDKTKPEDNPQEKVDVKLYGQEDIDGFEGYVTKANGDFETIVGIVTNYDSKVLENGSVECSVTLTSKNAALMSSPKYVGNDEISAGAKFEFDLESLIFFEQALYLGGDADRDAFIENIDNAASLTQANSTITMQDELQFEKWLDLLKYQSFGTTENFPPAISHLSGVFIKGPDAEGAEDSYISWGLLEDRILNKYFGHGNDATDISEDPSGNMTVRIDSADGFTRFDNGFIEKQEKTNAAPNFIIPDYWDYTFNTRKGVKNFGNEKSKAGLSIKERLKEFLERDTFPGTEGAGEKHGVSDLDSFKSKVNVDEYKTIARNVKDGKKRWIDAGGSEGLITKFDKGLKRVPIREVFIHTKIVVDAFKNPDNLTVKDIIMEMLDKVNEEAYGLWNWTLAGEDNILKINDQNYTPLGTGQFEERESAFNRMFKFNVMSKNSIVKNYDINFSMPDGDIGTMYAIQALSGTPAKIHMRNDIMESHSALQTILNNSPGYTGVGVKYLPDNGGAYNALSLESNMMDLKTKTKFLKQGARNIKRGFRPGADYGAVIEIRNIASVMQGEDDATEGNSESKQKSSWNVDKRISIMNEQNPRPAVGLEDFYSLKITGDFIQDDHYKSPPLPITLNLTIYGISSLKPGDTFRVDFLPQQYLSSVYFQIIKVTQELDSSGWYTSLETQFRVSPHNYKDTNSNDKPEDIQSEAEANLIKIIRDNAHDEEQAQRIINKMIFKPNQKNESLNPRLEHEGMNGDDDGFLSTTIDDGHAYMYGFDSKAFSTRAWRGLANQAVNKIQYLAAAAGPLTGGIGFGIAAGISLAKGWYGVGYDISSDWIHIAYHRRTSDYFKPEIHDSYTRVGAPDGSNWDQVDQGIVEETGVPPYVKFDYTVPSENAPLDTKVGQKYDKIYLNRNFETLMACIDNIEEDTVNKYDYLDRVFKCQIAPTLEQPVYIANPMYYWDEDVDKYNGYGNWSTTYDADGQGNHFTILGGVYLPGEHCYLIINKTHGAFGHWALLPQRKINPESGQIISDDSGLVDLKHYDVSTQSVRWGESEWTDEGWDNDKSPTRY